MNESKTLEVNPGNTVFVSVGFNGEATTIYTCGESLPVLLEAFERFLKAEGYSFEGHLDTVNNDEEMKWAGWAVDVRNFLDSLTDPERYGHYFSDETGREIVAEAVRLRDA